MLATSLRELWRSSIWYLTTWDEKTFWIFPIKDIFKKTLRHSASASDHKETLFKYPVQWFMLTCRVLGWSGLSRTFPFLSPLSSVPVSLCQSRGNTQGSRMTSFSCEDEKQKCRTPKSVLTYDSARQRCTGGFIFFIKARSDSVPIGARNRSFHRWARLCSKHGSSFLQCW